VPETLAHSMALFQATGRIRRAADDLFTDLAWAQVMIGQGLMPAAHHPLADSISDAELAGFLASIDRALDGAVAAMPGHDVWLARHCMAPAGMAA
jgi:tryptophan halogenase